MVTKTYTFDGHYKGWAKNNSDVEHLILKGILPFEKILDFVKAFSEIPFKSIDISDFSIEIDGLNYETRYDVFWKESYSDFYWNDAPFSSLEKVLFNKEFATAFHWENGFLLDDTKTVIIDAKTHESMEIPEGTLILGHLFLYNMGEVSGVKFPNSLKTIGKFAFYFTSIINPCSVYIPDSVHCIGEAAFQGCDLEEVRLSSNLTSIPYACFQFNILESIDLPNKLKKIEAEAFMGCYFDEITIPEGVEEIESNFISGHICGHIKFPSTLKILAEDFYYEDGIDEPEDCVPFIEVHPDNPVFFAQNGTLYKRENPAVPYLGYSYET